MGCHPLKGKRNVPFYIAKEFNLTTLYICNLFGRGRKSYRFLSLPRHHGRFSGDLTQTCTHPVSASCRHRSFPNAFMGQLSCIGQSSLNILFGELGIVVNDLCLRQTLCQPVQNYGDFDTSIADAGSSSTHLRF